jgi:hypothetical protein
LKRIGYNIFFGCNKLSSQIKKQFFSN